MAGIWIDLDNAPHVPLFAPIIRELAGRGHRVWVTVRDYGYTIALLDGQEIPYTTVSRHPGKSRILKVAGLADRVLGLAQRAAGRRLDVAVSHGSRGLVIASKLLQIPSLTLYDYEFVSTGIFNRLSSRVLLPDILPDSLLRSIGLDPAQTGCYPGLKEEVYLGSFTPDQEILQELNLPANRTIAVLRPPATSAHYHNRESEAIFQAVLDRISTAGDAFGVVLPRTSTQATEVTKLLKNPLNFLILRRPVHGLNLMWHADLVVSAGGTMNREAAVLGVPVYSIFTGKLGTIDHALSEQGRLTLVRSVEGVTQIKLERRVQPDISVVQTGWQGRSELLVDCICREILTTAKESRMNTDGHG